ncbi:hypothetical protein HPP92_004977 [Vanilla planifolia]|uniref:Stigma-specific STIG1-like protein 1 n=1 Tax=Vanilla planifolia TaxID=51239 RepID=A0A835RXU9_VANPL|nr:hypothetical protein HPP92_004977 [Vanilla planifolia]
MRPTLISTVMLFLFLAAAHSSAHPTIHGEKEEAANSRPSPSLRRMSGESSKVIKTCDKFPSVCWAEGSPGPDCCKKTCANVTSDPLNCGGCGRKCRYGQTCCGGSCVNVVDDPSNCGECGKRCRKESFCRYGLCGYAN